MPKMQVAVADKDNANYVAGRRAFFKYRDLGVTEGTNGFMRAQVTSAEQGMSKPTGWHVHKCQAPAPAKRLLLKPLPRMKPDKTRGWPDRRLVFERRR